MGSEARSRMDSFRRIMTVQEFVDIIACLQSLGEDEPSAVP